MIRKIFITLILIIGFNNLALADCNFRIANFGDTKDKLKLDQNLPKPFLMPDQFGGENLILPLEAICNNNDKLYGTNLILLYINNKFVRFQLYRPIMPDRNLMEFAMKKYGEFIIPGTTSKKDWRGNFRWRINNETIEYIINDIHDGHVEILEITNSFYENEISKYNEKVGEWLDTRN